MSMNNFKYSFSQAKKNIWRNGLMSLASLFTIASCLIILGIFTVLTMNVNHITAQIKDQCEIQLFVKKDTSDTRVRAIKNEIAAIPNVKTAELFTKEDMLNRVKQDMFEGKEELASGFDEDNPFSDSYKITLNDIGQTSETVAQLEKIQDMDHVVNEQDFVNTVLAVSGVVKKASLIVMAILLIIAIVIISNTVKLTVFNRRKEINIMKYIGATNQFIRVPFVIEGILIGLLGSMVAFGLISWGYAAMEKFVLKMEINIFTLLPYQSIALIVAGIFLFTGCVIGMLGSLISMRKYLRV